MSATGAPVMRMLICFAALFLSVILLQLNSDILMQEYGAFCMIAVGHGRLILFELIQMQVCTEPTARTLYVYTPVLRSSFGSSPADPETRLILPPAVVRLAYLQRPLFPAALHCYTGVNNAKGTACNVI